MKLPLVVLLLIELPLQGLCSAVFLFVLHKLFFMNNTMNRLLRCLQLEYLAFWGLVVLTAILYECEVLPQGILVDNPQTAYILEVLGILLAVCLIPFSLRLFSLSLVRNVQERALVDALISYRRWSEIRLALLFVPAIINLAVYYWTLETAGLLCVAMVMIASLFCVPGKQRMASELNLYKAKEEEEA